MLLYSEAWCTTQHFQSARRIPRHHTALGAADAGLFAFGLSDAARPVWLWTCGLDGGEGWNLYVDTSESATPRAYVADRHNGLVLVQIPSSANATSPTLPVVVAHSGMGDGPFVCNMSLPS